MAQLTPTLWPLAADFRAAPPRWHLSGARRPQWRLQWAQPDLTFPATPHGIQPRTKSLCNSHSSCEHRLQHQDVEKPCRRHARLSIDNAQQQSRSLLLLLHPASWHRGLLILEDGEQRRRRSSRRRRWRRRWRRRELKRHSMRPRAQVRDSGDRRQKDPFLAAVDHFYVSFYFLTHICVNNSVVEL